jgi:hypothetical protein
MPGFLDLPLELRNHVYELLLTAESEPQFRGVMVVSEHYVKKDLPLQSYRGLLRVCRQIYYEFKHAIQHLAASKELIYELDVTFSHGRPYFSLTWIRLAALSPTINHLFINVDLRIREPFNASAIDAFVPHDHELAHLLEDAPESFAVQLFDYIAILLKTLATLLQHANPDFSVLYTEVMTINLRTPTRLLQPVLLMHNPVETVRRVGVDRAECSKLHSTMKSTLQATSKGFQAFDASACDTLFPLIQIGSLRFATEGQVWGEGHNMVLAHDDFQWLRY